MCVGVGGGVPAGETPLADTLCERMMAIQPSTSTAASFLSSEGEETWLETHHQHQEMAVRQMKVIKNGSAL